MTWVKLSDTFAEEFEELGAEALALHVAALGYCGRLLTDGVIPARKARLLFPLDDPDTVIKALVDAGRWSESASGYEIVGYHLEQPSAETVRRHQRLKAERQQKWLNRRRDASGDASQDASGDAHPAPPRPAPPRRGEGGREGASPSGSPGGSPSSSPFPEEGQPDLRLYMGGRA